MFSLPGLLALILVEYLRPQEYVAFLSTIPLLHIATALAVLGFVLDLRLGLARPQAAPHLALALLLLVWCLVTVTLRAPDQFLARADRLVIPIVAFVVVSHGVQGFRSLQVVCGLLLAIALILSALGVHQGLAPYGCHRIAVKANEIVLLYDGRPCGTSDRNACENEAGEPGADYACEKVGLLGTQSDHGRVRYRGSLQDPNELSLALGITMPFAFAFFDRRRTVLRGVLVVLTAGLVGLCAYFTQSRGGQLVYLTVLAVYFVRRIGLRRGIVAGVVLSLPILLLGGRTGGEASTMERIECWWTGLHLLVASPAFGVGHGQFTEHHYLTAHNSFILAGAELGVPGLLVWSSIVYVALKIPLEALRANLPPMAKTWATAILSALAGLLVGSMFLSYTYKNVFWIYVGLAGMLYHAIRRHEPGFDVRFGIRDLGIVALADLVLFLALVGYTGLKMGW